MSNKVRATLRQNPIATIAVAQTMAYRKAAWDKVVEICLDNVADDLKDEMREHLNNMPPQRKHYLAKKLLDSL